MGFRRKTRIVEKGPSGASRDRGAGGRGGSTRRSVMTLIPIVGVAAWKTRRLDAAWVSPAWAAGSARACGSARRDIETGSTVLFSLRLAVQDVALSRRKQGFESPRERQELVRLWEDSAMTPG